MEKNNNRKIGAISIVAILIIASSLYFILKNDDLDDFKGLTALEARKIADENATSLLSNPMLIKVESQGSMDGIGTFDWWHFLYASVDYSSWATGVVNVFSNGTVQKLKFYPADYFSSHYISENVIDSDQAYQIGAQNAIIQNFVDENDAVVNLCKLQNTTNITWMIVWTYTISGDPNIEVRAEAVIDANTGEITGIRIIDRFGRITVYPNW
jgi:hypothetical protein